MKQRGRVTHNEVWVLGLFTTGERWATLVYGGFEAMKRAMEANHGIIIELDAPDFASGKNPKDPSQTAAARLHTVWE